MNIWVKAVQGVLDDKKAVRRHAHTWTQILIHTHTHRLIHTLTLT